MEKWAGILNGTNRGIVFFSLDVDKENKTSGNITLYDTENTDLSAKFHGEIKNNRLVAKLYEFTPQGEGSPTCGDVSLSFSKDKKELKGKWSTNAGTKGECILYKNIKQQQTATPTTTPTTLETRDITITYCTFNKKNIESLFQILSDVANAKASSTEKPIYTITYDKEERVRTFEYEDFTNKFKEAERIWYIGFEFRDKTGLNNIIVNIYHQANLLTTLRSNIVVESTESKAVTAIAEMARGIIGKVANKHARYHSFWFEATTQIVAVLTMLALSFLAGRSLAVVFSNDSLKYYGSVGALILLSNFWTYIQRLFRHGFINKVFPVVEIINRPKNRIAPIIGFGAIGSVVATVIIWAITILAKALVTK